MKVIVQIICKDQDEFDRGDQLMCDVLKSIRRDDFIYGDVFIAPRKEVTDDAEE